MCNIDKIISNMTLEEKARLCSGIDAWHTASFKKHGVPSLFVSDGPHGLRTTGEGVMSLGETIPSTCFPTAVSLASSWDRELVKSVGAAIGRECRKEGVHVILGPGVNIKRSPLGGRNFEYFSEDPFLAGEMAAAHISGVQSTGVGTSLKHFCANNQESERMTINAIIDERTLREIYLASFERAVKEAKPTTLMCSYNRVNGKYSAENKYILTDILRDEWGFDGFVMSDWGAVNEIADSVAAGLELEMPTSGEVGPSKIVAAVKNGTLDEKLLDKAVERILNIVFKLCKEKDESVCDMEENNALACQAEIASAVLLKNENALLPLDKKGKIAVLGGLAKDARIQGAGSSKVNPYKVADVLESMKKCAPEAEISFSLGYASDALLPDEKLISQAVEEAKKADVAVIFAGLPELIESEGWDRTDMKMPASHIKLIEAVSAAQKNTVVVLSNGSPVEMDWADSVPAILEAYLGGQAFGAAVPELLFGNVSPSGRLAESFPIYLENNPSYGNFPGDEVTVNYAEGVFVGYRWYTSRKLPTRYPFGYGLSYTTFELSDLALDKAEMKDTETLKVSVTVSNTGSVAGAQVVQVYVAPDKCSVARPVRELKGFEKVFLAPGESKRVTVELDKRAFAYYDAAVSDWRAESGIYTVEICENSEKVLLSAQVRVEDTLPKPAGARTKFDRNSTISQLMRDELGIKVFDYILSQVKADPNVAEMFSGDDVEKWVGQTPLRSCFGMWFSNKDENDLESLIEMLNSDEKRQEVLAEFTNGEVPACVKALYKG